MAPPDETPANYKTIICKHWKVAACPYGPKCCFAHGEHELRGYQHKAQASSSASEPQPASSSRGHIHQGNSLFKTSLCRWWQQHGNCQHGASCVFAHGDAELRPAPSRAVASAGAASRTTAAAGSAGGTGKGRAAAAAAGVAAPATPPPSVRSRPEAERLVVRSMEESDVQAMRIGLEFLAKRSEQKAVPPSNFSGLSLDDGNGAWPHYLGEVGEDGEAPPQPAAAARGAKPGKQEPALLSRQHLATFLTHAVISHSDLDLLKELLRFWSQPQHGCWTLLLSDGPVAQGAGAEGPGHKCVLLHDLVRQVATEAPSLPLPTALEMISVITLTRPSSVLDRDPEGRLPLELVMAHGGKELVSALAPLSHLSSEAACTAQERALHAALMRGLPLDGVAATLLISQTQDWYAELEKRKRGQQQAQEQAAEKEQGKGQKPSQQKLAPLPQQQTKPASRPLASAQPGGAVPSAGPQPAVAARDAGSQGAGAASAAAVPHPAPLPLPQPAQPRHTTPQSPHPSNAPASLPQPPQPPPQPQQPQRVFTAPPPRYAPPVAQWMPPAGPAHPQPSWNPQPAPPPGWTPPPPHPAYQPPSNSMPVHTPIIIRPVISSVVPTMRPPPPGLGFQSMAPHQQ